MSATNSTANINLPLFIGTDKPAWLTDWNGTMNAIDTAIANLQTAESGTATSLAALAQSLEALSGTVSQHTTALQTITTAVSGNTGSINTINSLIGNGQPTTEDKTIIGAINEIYAEIGGGDGVAADDVTYNNNESGLTATDVQGAIDELKDDIDNIEPSKLHEVIATATADGVKTLSAMLNELNTQLTALGLADDVMAETYLYYDHNVASCVYANKDAATGAKWEYERTYVGVNLDNITNICYLIGATSSAINGYINAQSQAVFDGNYGTNKVPVNGTVFEIILA